VKKINLKLKNKFVLIKKEEKWDVVLEEKIKL
jgi:hypothetical protein